MTNSEDLSLTRANSVRESNFLTIMVCTVMASSVLTSLLSVVFIASDPSLARLLKYSNLLTLIAEALFAFSAFVAVPYYAINGRMRRPGLMSSVLLIGLFLFMVYVTVLNFENVNFFHALWRPMHLLFLMALGAFWLCGLRPNLKWVLWTTVAIGAAHMLNLVIFGMDYSSPLDAVWNGTFPSFTYVTHGSYLLAPIAVIGGAAFFLVRKSWLLPVAILFVVLMIYPFWTGSRGGALASVCGIGLLLLFPVMRRKWRVLGLLVLVIITFELARHLPQIGRWPDISARMLQHDLTEVSADRFSSGRISFWKNALAKALERPWIGHGPQTTARLLHETRPNSYNHPHNIFLQIFLLWGAVGAMFFAAIAAISAGPLFRALKTRRPEVIMAFGYLITLAGHALIDGGLYYPFNMVIAIGVGFSLWAIGKERLS